MPREKDAELWTAVSGLLALVISRAYHNFSLWHHEFIEAKLSAALVVLMRFIPTRLCSGAALVVRKALKCKLSAHCDAHA